MIGANLGPFLLDTGRGRLLNVSCTFNLRPVSRGLMIKRLGKKSKINGCIKCLLRGNTWNLKLWKMHVIILGKLPVKVFISNKAFYDTFKLSLTNQGFVTNKNRTVKQKNLIVADNSKLANKLISNIPGITSRIQSPLILWN